MEVDEWQKRLTDNFSRNGIVGFKLMEIINQERECAEYFTKNYLGQDRLMHSFQDFYIETIEELNEWIMRNGWPHYDHFIIAYMYFIITFKRIRACENLMLRGYYYDGLSLIRDLKDRAILLNGVVNNITKLPLICYGPKSVTTYDEWMKAKNERKKEEFRVKSIIIGKESGLPPDIIKELKRWDNLFNDEVHGSKFSLFMGLGDLLTTRRIPSLGPAPDKSISIYMNRICEVSWMILNLLPYLQPHDQAFSESWHKKKIILDESFQYVQEALGDLGKKIGRAFVFFMNQKFKSKSQFFYSEPDRTS